MLISLCIPTYNGSKYLDACLQSVCGQTFPDFEILICDDCSTDDTISIIKKFQEKNSRIKLFVNEKNLGLVGNWNRCIELAQGEWIKFIFQDDLILPSCLQKMTDVITQDTQMVVCEREYLFEQEITSAIKNLYFGVPRLYQFAGNEKTKVISSNDFCSLVRTHFPSNFIGEPTSVMFRKSITKEIGFFNSHIAQLCDLEYCLRIGVKAGFIYIPDKLVSFRVHGTSTSQKNNAEKYFASIYSDRILVLYALLFDPVYEDFRKNCTKKEISDLKYNLFYIVYHADLYVKTEDKNNLLFKEMQSVKELCPEIKKYRKYYPLYATLKFWIRPIRQKIALLAKKQKNKS
jgi:glycosyltransferase involved in cell wall biosynthesis